MERQTKNLLLPNSTGEGMGTGCSHCRVGAVTTVSSASIFTSSAASDVYRNSEKKKDPCY